MGMVLLRLTNSWSICASTLYQLCALRRIMPTFFSSSVLSVGYVVAHKTREFLLAYHCGMRCSWWLTIGLRSLLHVKVGKCTMCFAIAHLVLPVSSPSWVVHYPWVKSMGESGIV